MSMPFSKNVFAQIGYLVCIALEGTYEYFCVVTVENTNDKDAIGCMQVPT
jgi:hypothetical protein